MPTLIMRWLASRGTLSGEFNQTMLFQAPPRAEHGDDVLLLQALLDRHAMLPLRAADSPQGQSGTYSLLPAGTVRAADCVTVVDEFSDAAFAAALGCLDPGRGAMVHAVWAAPARQLLLIVHHLAVDAVSWTSSAPTSQRAGGSSRRAGRSPWKAAAPRSDAGPRRWRPARQPARDQGRDRAGGSHGRPRRLDLVQLFASGAIRRS
ncbi:MULTISPECIES: hypothetical protein [Streptomyces]|uniref:hypothetical protein n=1 Tax=Streptomyces TaxID=1883 RepID=UPI00093B8B0F|nr:MULTISPECIES: hypothetical protein [unclassified Streptomyces]OKJ08921.1 hypothetical protein AMK20_23820 [Streptomyces sp. TSRI0261]QNQ32990.1 hypothetical protein HYC88_04385 [Streptomyces sp. CB00271]